jgi:hypothetical protein
VSAIIPGSVINLTYGLFYNCTNLKSVTLGEGLLAIGDSVFYNCTNLTSITIPNSIESITNYCFENSINLTNIGV